MSLNEASNVDPSLLLSDATLAALNLPQQPFGPLEPNSTSFSDETTTEQIADVKQALITGDDLLLILGDAGAGKTVMLKQLGEHSGIRIQCFAVKGSERFSTMNLFAGLLDAFKHSPPEKLQDLLNDLIPYLQTMTARNTLSVIILDDAHKVKESELTQLLSAMLYINSHDETVMRIAMISPTPA
jgi:type II secretory pathway predicted ATPase ExeA